MLHLFLPIDSSRTSTAGSSSSGGVTSSSARFGLACAATLGRYVTSDGGNADTALGNERPGTMYWRWILASGIGAAAGGFIEDGVGGLLFIRERQED